MQKPWQIGLNGLNAATEQLRPFIQRLNSRLRPLERTASTAAVALGVVPLSWQSPGLSLALNHALQELIDAGELDFLEGRCCTIAIRDRRLHWPLTLSDGRLTLAPDQAADVTISATVPAFLDLISQQADPDTLFFQRQLSIEGDVELGLYVKNLLDALDEDDLPSVWQKALYALRLGLALEQSSERGDHR